MGFWDQFVSSAKTVANAAGEKAGELYEVSRLKLQALQVNNDLQKEFERLGRMVYDQGKHGTDNSELIEGCAAEIENLLAALDELNDMIHDEVGTISCPSCGESIPLDSVYCSKCGAKVVEEAAAAPAVNSEPAILPAPAPEESEQ